MRLAIFFSIILISSPSYAKHAHLEKWYQEKWCRGELEYILPDQTRIDCLTETNAIEFDFARKWYEAIGQALYYSLQTGRRGGIVLIMEEPADIKYWIRMNSVIDQFKLPVDTWKMEDE